MANYLFSIALALIPAAVWLVFILSKKRPKKIQIGIFLSGIIIIIPAFLANYLLFLFPEYNFIEFIESQYRNIHIQFVIGFAWISILEEILKQWIVRKVDAKRQIIQTINDSIHYSLITALGFSFAENIFYFYQVAGELSSTATIFTFVYRSIFTTCAHMVFSGFFGYLYGIAKFSINIFEQHKALGKKLFLPNFFANLLNISRIQAYREITIAKGLIIAILLHTSYNYLLQLQLIWAAAALIIFSFIILLSLLRNKAGNLILIHDTSQNRASTMAEKDEDVVIELMGMWFNQKRYVDVIHICERLLKRDPDNKVVQIFKAKAIDGMKKENPYRSILEKIFPVKQKNIFGKPPSTNSN